MDSQLRNNHTLLSSDYTVLVSSYSAFNVFDYNLEKNSAEPWSLPNSARRISNPDAYSSSNLLQSSIFQILKDYALTLDVIPSIPCCRVSLISVEIFGIKLVEGPWVSCGVDVVRS